MSKKLESIVNRFNQKNPIGTPVRFWTGVKEGEGKLSKLRAPAEVFGGHTPVAWVDDHGACIALTHIERA